MHDNQIKTLEEIACNACFQWLVVLVRAPQRNKTYRPFIHKSLGICRGLVPGPPPQPPHPHKSEDAQVP